MTDTTKNYHQMNLPEHFAKSRLNSSSLNHTIEQKKGIGIQGYCPNRIVNGNMNFDGDCINMCAKTLVECCKKFGSENFKFGSYTAKYTNEFKECYNVSQEQYDIMKSAGNIVHFYVINTKLNKVIDRSQGQFQFVDYNYFIQEKLYRYGEDNVMMWGIPVDHLIRGGLDITQIRKVRGLVNMLSDCIRHSEDTHISLVVNNFGEYYKKWITMFKKQKPREYKNFLKCCRIDQEDVDNK